MIVFTIDCLNNNLIKIQDLKSIFEKYIILISINFCNLSLYYFCISHVSMIYADFYTFSKSRPLTMISSFVIYLTILIRMTIIEFSKNNHSSKELSTCIA